MAKSYRSAPRKSGWSPEPLRGSVFWLLAEVTRFRTTSPAPKSQGNMLVRGDSSAGELPAAPGTEEFQITAGVIINSASHRPVSGPHRATPEQKWHNYLHVWLTGRVFALTSKPRWLTNVLHGCQIESASEQVFPSFLLAVIFQFLGINVE